MKKSYHRKPLIVFILYIVFWICMSIALSFLLGKSFDLTKLIPISDIGIEVGLFSIVLIPLSSIIGLFTGGYLFSPLFLYIHKKILGSKIEYGFYNKPRVNKLTFFSEGFFTSLMAINFSILLLSPQIVALSAGNVDVQTGFATTFVVLLVLTMFISNSLFSTTWFLSDAGILYSNSKKVQNKNKPPEIRSVGRWYGQFLKGYAGVSVVFSYIEFIYIFLIGTTGDPVFIVLLIIFIPFPIFMIIPTIPALLISDITTNHRIKYVRKFASRIGIHSNIDMEFRIIE